MVKFLKRLLGQSSFVGDLALGDWTPVPAGACAAVAAHEWVSSFEPPPIQRSWPSEASYLDALTDEERAIVLAQRECKTPAVPPPIPIPDDDQQFRQVVVSCGEHLSAEELKIIRQQLGGLAEVTEPVALQGVDDRIEAAWFAIGEDLDERDDQTPIAADLQHELEQRVRELPAAAYRKFSLVTAKA